MTEVARDLDQLSIDTIRTLSIDAVQKANSGHPGAPMGAAPMAYVLWTRHLRHAPTEPSWPNRDRFVLSAGHASMLLYSLLYLTGYGLTIEELQNFRRWGSRTPGHPERGMTPGVEVTTGPLGQGFANGVGMAIAQYHLAAEFNRPDNAILDHFVYAICSDGDLQEGIASEAASLAGHLRLGKLVYLYDDNHIQLDGPTSMAFNGNVLERFDAYGWHTAQVEDGNDVAAIGAAIEAARGDGRPSLIAVRTHIAFGAPTKHDSQKAHGAPLGEDEVRGAKESYGWDPDKHFFVPDDALEFYRQAVPAGAKLAASWRQTLARYAAAFPAEAAELERRLARKLPGDWEASLKSYAVGDSLATRKASQEAINALAKPLPELFGGSADLSESNLTDIEGAGIFEATNPGGRNIRFGVREHAMGAAVSGIALYGGFFPYAATFLTFSDYMRGAVRLAAMSRLRLVYVWTHDSIGVGEDGPTHEPIEHIASLRAIPNLTVFRPGDANETTAAWACAVGLCDGPSALTLSRQKMPVLEGTAKNARLGVAKGGYVLRHASGDATAPDLILIGTGSELQLAVAAAAALETEGIRCRVVSLPSWERFEAQDEAYRESVLPRASRKRLTVEAGSPLGWERYAGDDGVIVGIDRFGASAQGDDIFKGFGITAERVTDLGRKVVREGLRGRIVATDPGSSGH